MYEFSHSLVENTQTGNAVSTTGSGSVRHSLSCRIQHQAIFLPHSFQAIFKTLTTVMHCYRQLH